LEKIKYKILFPKYFLNLFLSYSYCTLFILPLYLLFLFIRKIIKTKVSWFFSRFSGFHVSLGLLLIAFNMVSEQSNNETLENNLGETQIEIEPVTVVAAAMEQLLQNLQKPSIYPTGVVSQAYEPPSDQKLLHAPLLSSAWAVSSHRPAHSLLRTVGCPTVKPFRPFASSRAAYELRTATLNRKSFKSVQ